MLGKLTKSLFGGSSQSSGSTSPFLTASRESPYWTGMFKDMLAPEIQNTFYSTGINDIQNSALQRLASGPGGTGDLTRARGILTNMPAQTYSDWMGAAKGFSDQAGGFLQGSQPFFQQGMDYTTQGTQRLDDATFGQGLARFMNPYTQSVIAPTIANMQDVAAERRNDLNQQASRFGAFGGSAQGVENAQITRDLTRDVGEFTGNLMSQNFGQARDSTLGQFNNEQGRMLQGAGLSYQGGQGMLSGAGQAGALAGMAGNLGAQQDAMRINRADALQRLRQSSTDDFYRQQEAALGAGNFYQQNPMDRVNFLGNALRQFYPFAGTNYSKGSSENGIIPGMFGR